MTNQNTDDDENDEGWRRWNKKAAGMRCVPRCAACARANFL